jgi:hypothetical protein
MGGRKCHPRQTRHQLARRRRVPIAATRLEIAFSVAHRALEAQEAASSTRTPLAGRFGFASLREKQGIKTSLQRLVHQR